MVAKSGDSFRYLYILQFVCNFFFFFIGLFKLREGWDCWFLGAVGEPWNISGATGEG